MLGLPSSSQSTPPAPDMRAGAGFNATEKAVPGAPGGGGHSSGWHSPVPYLFGGLAAMLGLIAFALLLLSCSYWKLSGYQQEGGRRRRRRRSHSGDAEAAEPKAGAEVPVPVACYEEKFVVIMAGDEKPTYLATPISSRASSFGDRSSKDMDGGDDEKMKEKDESNGADCTGTSSETRNKEHEQGNSERQNLPA